MAAGRDGVYVSYWKPSLLLQLIVDEGRYEQGTMPHAYEMYLRHYRNVQGRRFRPLLYVNELTVPARPCRRDSPACRHDVFALGFSPLHTGRDSPM